MSRNLTELIDGFDDSKYAFDELDKKLKNHLASKQINNHRRAVSKNAKLDTKDRQEKRFFIGVDGEGFTDANGDHH